MSNKRFRQLANDKPAAPEVSSKADPVELLRATETLAVEWAALPNTPPSNSSAAFERLNAFLRTYAAWLTAMENAGHADIADDLRASLCASMSGAMNREQRDISRGEQRALVASALYHKNYRLPLLAGKGDRMVAAMLAADLFIDTGLEVGPDADEDAWKSAFIRNYDRLAKSIDLSDEDTREKVHNRVRKSIARFKKHITAEPMYRFNADRLQFEKVSFTETAHGLGQKPGRPKTQGE